MTPNGYSYQSLGPSRPAIMHYVGDIRDNCDAQSQSRELLEQDTDADGRRRSRFLIEKQANARLDDL